MTLLIDVSLTHDVEIDYPDDEVSRMIIDDTTRYMFLKTFDGTGFEVKDLDMKFVEEKADSDCYQTRFELKRSVGRLQAHTAMFGCKGE